MASGWRVIGASVQGAAHQKAGLACQDAHAYRVLPNGVLLVAVADGAGSAERSEAGAQRAVMATLDALEAMAVWPEDEVGWSEVMAGAFSQAQRCLDQFAESESLPPRAFATTLTCVAASEAGLAVGQLGDGVAVAGLEPGELFIAAPPQRGEYANETYFLTQAEALQQVDVRYYPRPVRMVAAMTDGLTRLAVQMALNEPHLPFFQPLLAFAAGADDEAEAQSQLATFLASERVCARTDDDKTLVLALRRPPSE